MSVGFGFSVGDFIAGIQLVRDVITSLQASGGSSSEYQALAMELFSLERALLEVKALKSLDDQPEKLEALKCAASQCQHTIDRFMTKIHKFQSSLNAQGSGSRWRDCLRKVQWAMCKKEDIATFKAEISGHAIAINLLVATAQFNNTTLLSQRSEQFHKESQESSTALATLTSWPTAAMNSLKNSIASCLRQGQELLATSKNIVQTNIQIFRAVLEIQKSLTALPAQILREQPVYFTDAYGLEVPFHLEFVYSSEILHDWLLRRFPKNKEMIEDGEFDLQDMKTKRTLSLSDQWATQFYPGMRVAMDIVFSWHVDVVDSPESCPNCGLPSLSLGTEEVNTCLKCGTVYANLPQIETMPKDSLGVIWAKSKQPMSRFRRTKTQLLIPYQLHLPKLPSWPSRSFDDLRLRYPDDRFHGLMAITTIDDVTSELDSLSCISCDDCREEFAVRPWNQSHVERLETHLQTRTHRQLVEARRSGIDIEHSIISEHLEPTHVPMLQPSSESDEGESSDCESLVSYEDRNSYLLPSSSSSPVSFEPPPDERMVDCPPDRTYHEQIEGDVDDLAGGDSCSDTEALDIPEEEGFGHVSLGSKQLDRVNNNRKRNAPASSEDANPCVKRRAGKRRRGKR